MRGSGVPGASGSMMPPSGSRPGYLGSGSGSGSGPTTTTTTAVPPSATSSSVPGEKRMVNQVDTKALTSHTHSHARSKERGYSVSESEIKEIPYIDYPQVAHDEKDESEEARVSAESARIIHLQVLREKVS